MKRILLFILFAIFSYFQIKAQKMPFLSYEKHAMQIGNQEKTQVADFLTTGDAGPSRVWDFSKLNCKGAHYASIVDAKETPFHTGFPEANSAIYEHGNYFYFNTTEDGTDFLGWVNKQTVIKYNKPVTKMKYPFKFNDHFEGTYTGHTVVSVIQGEYSITADGFGSLYLPQGVVIDKALRVKSYDHYIESACNSLEVETTKYLWYALDNRYPLLVVIIRTETLAGHEPVTRKYTVYNDNLVPSIGLKKVTDIASVDKPNIAYTIFPNPYKNLVKINYSLDKEREVNVEVFDMLGSKIEVIVNTKQSAGNYTYDFNPEKFNLPPAIYFVKLMFDDRVYLEKIVGAE